MDLSRVIHSLQAGFYKGFRRYKTLIKHKDKVVLHKICSYHHHQAFDLFSDLKSLNQGEGTLGVVKYYQPATKYLLKTGIRNDFDFVTQHIVRPNNQNDLEIYKIAVQEWNKGKRLKIASK